MTPARPPERAIEASLVAVAVAMRLPGLLGDPLWQDEVASARVIEERSLEDVVRRVGDTESTPPGWYVLAWFLHRLGLATVDVRFLSLVCSAALVAVVFRYARGLVGSAPAAFAAVLAAVGWQFVVHGRELRAYALYTLLAGAFALALTRASARPTRVRLVLLAAVAAAGVATHWFFGSLVVAALAWVWTASLSRAVRLRLTAACGGGAVALAALAPVLAEQISGGRFGWIGDFELLKAAYLYGVLFDDARSLYADVPAPFGLRQLAWLAVGGLVLAGCVLLGRRSPAGRLCAMLAVVPAGLAAVAWSAGADVFNARNLVGIAPFAAVAVAAAVGAIPGGLLLAPALAALACAASLTANPPGFPGDRTARELVGVGWERDDALALVGLNYGFRSAIGWYLPGRPAFDRVPCPELRGDAFLVGVYAPARARLYALTRQGKRNVGILRVARMPRAALPLLRVSDVCAVPADRRGRSP